jgi:hypothetical protein
MSDDLNDEMAQASTALFIQHGIDAIRAKVNSATPSKAFCECCVRRTFRLPVSLRFRAWSSVPVARR